MKKITIPQKEDIINYFITEGHTKKECSEFFDVSETTFVRWLHIYNIIKTNDDIKRQNIEKYGCEHSLQRKDIRQKGELTNLKKYGCKNPSQNKDIRKKMQQTCLEKYGTKIASQSQIVKDKVAKTNLAKYGVSCVFASDKVKEKSKQTCLQKYGTTSAIQSKQVKEKIRQSNLKKYGVPYFTQYHFNCSADSIDILSSKEKLQEYLSHLNGKLTMHEISFLLKCNYQRVQKAIQEFKLNDLVSIWPGYSYKEKQLQDFIKTNCTNNMICNARDILGNNQEIDIYCPDQKIAIEFNGTYWHSIEILQSKGNDKKYHFNKSLSAQNKGIRLIHIYEHEWDDPVKRKIIESMLKIAFSKIDNKIYARKCVIKEISNQEAKDFNNNNHLQGHRNAQITLGLFYKDKLVQLMSFSKTKYNKNLKSDNSWEIIRGCPGSNNIVIGGVSKLFYYFVKHYKPEEIFSYCDFNKFDGRSYEALGMKFTGYTNPDMKWILQNNIVVDRKPSKHKQLKLIARTQLFGSGSKKYLWKKGN